MESRIGELAALGTALCWTITALSFESAGRRIGSMTVNIVRLVMAAAFFAVYGWLVRGLALPFDASGTAWGWLGLSGLVGFVIGDLFLFQAFVDIGARVAMLIYASVPPLTAIMARFALDERLTSQGVLGMVLTVVGIAIVVLRRPAQRTPEDGGPSGTDAVYQPAPHAVPDVPAEATPAHRAHHVRGALFAFGGALGQAGGLILGRIGAGVTLNPFAATQIRVFAGIIGFAVLFTVTRRWGTVAAAVRNAAAMRRVGLGALFGPFLGVSLGLYAAQNTSAGIASTIMALVPVLIIVPSVIVFKERVTVREVLGAVVAVIGVGLLFT